ncbi:MAG: alpha/beta hydrolase [Elainella sp. Prado103]|nr:alpha/beta hydrolase [Elainella sp. Prado103]
MTPPALVAWIQQLQLPVFCSQSSRKLWGWSCLIGVWLPIGLETNSAWAADRVTISYGILERSIQVESLVQYADDGTVAQDLRSYTQLLDDSQRQQLRQALSARTDLDVVAVSQFLYTDQGEILLQRLGEVVRTDANLSGFYALRSALILAAASPEGLTFLNVLRQFPLENIQIDLGRTLQILGDLEQLIRQTQEAVLLIDQQAEIEAAAQPLNPNLPSLQRFGAFAWQLEVFEFRDQSRNRMLPVDLYLPHQRDQTPVLNTPVIVISHGLGSDRQSYAYLARQLVSYGFAVAVLEHPGSNAQQLQALISGTASEVTTPAEFVDRPLDVSYVLDRLEELNQGSLQGQFNLDQVGIVGHSFGGYTALALAGAEINFEQLTMDCAAGNPYNLSLLLQCRALDLAQPIQPLADPRIKAVIVINPIGSSLLGASDFSRIQVPVMILGSSADTVTPVLLEQIQPFTWLSIPDRYLVILQGATHFSTIEVPPEASANAIQLPSELVGADPSIAKAYLKVLSTGFFQAYLMQMVTARDYLESAYVQTINQAELPVALVQTLGFTLTQNEPMSLVR